MAFINCVRRLCSSLGITALEPYLAEYEWRWRQINTPKW